MKLAPFTKKEAMNLMERYNTLKDKQFTYEGKVFRVRIVTAVPFAEKDKLEVIDLFWKSFNKVQGVDAVTVGEHILFHQSDQYDLLLIATARGGNGTSIYSLPVALIINGQGELDYGFPITFHSHDNYPT